MKDQHQSVGACLMPATPGEGRASDRPLRVMKFGGTSVADASCICRVVEIIRAASSEASLVVVVSAMAGVTNQLIEAAAQAELKSAKAAAKILDEIRARHETAIDSLIASPEKKNRLQQAMQTAIAQIDELFYKIAMDGLSLQAKDFISSLGERLCAPIVAAALCENGVTAEAMNATAVIATDSRHGAANPLMDATRELCQARLQPRLRAGVVPVVTGFIGSNPEGVLTTLGRGGSDYSATILAAALGADEVVIWTDVDGLLTADPRAVPGACTIPEISYREASELAFFGAKVLHPKTLQALTLSGIPVWIRNTFSPQASGTKITQKPASKGSITTAVTAISEAALITVSGRHLGGAAEVWTRVSEVTSAVSADVFLLSQSSQENHVSLIVQSAKAKAIVEGLRRQLASECSCPVDNCIFETSVALVTVVGDKLRRTPGSLGRIFGALGRENIAILATAHGLADCKASFAIARKDLTAALAAIHREFELESLQHAVSLPVSVQPALWQHEPSCTHTDAD